MLRAAFVVCMYSCSMSISLSSTMECFTTDGTVSSLASQAWAPAPFSSRPITDRAVDQARNNSAAKAPAGYGHAGPLARPMILTVPGRTNIVRRPIAWLGATGSHKAFYDLAHTQGSRRSDLERRRSPDNASRTRLCILRAHSYLRSAVAPSGRVH